MDELLKAIFESIFESIFRRSKRGSDRDDQVQCVLRVKSGTQPGLSAKWHAGIVTVRPGEIEVHEYSGFRRLVGTHTIYVRSVDFSNPRRPTWRESQFSVDSDKEIGRLVTDRGVLEWAIDPDFRYKALNLLDPTGQAWIQSLPPARKRA